MDTVFFQISQGLFLILAAPLISGIIKKVKALLQGRKGPGIMQPYFDVMKYMRKDFMISNDASWIFIITPYIVFGAMVTIVMVMPSVSPHALFSFTGDLVLVVYLFALARVFTAMAGIDTGSAFGAMGSSRDMFISALAEPVLVLTILVKALPLQTTNLSAIVTDLDRGGLLINPSYFMILLSFVILIVAETGRIPVDNPDTHLELTMIHEGMLLEYSGKQLALMVWSSWIKQTVLFTFLIDFCFPWGLGSYHGNLIWLAGFGLFFLKLVCIGIMMACIEMSYAKIRLFKVPQLLSSAFVISLFALITEYLL
jgi:formate hydrogenlyase subunit 4